MRDINESTEDCKQGVFPPGQLYQGPRQFEVRLSGAVGVGCSSIRLRVMARTSMEFDARGMQPLTASIIG